jgi:hypothetical protein
VPQASSLGMLGMRDAPGTTPIQDTNPTLPLGLGESLDRSEMIKLIEEAKIQARKRSRKNFKKSKSINLHENPFMYRASLRKRV